MAVLFIVSLSWEELADLCLLSCFLFLMTQFKIGYVPKCVSQQLVARSVNSLHFCASVFTMSFVSAGNLLSWKEFNNSANKCLFFSDGMAFPSLLLFLAFRIALRLPRIPWIAFNGRICNNCKRKLIDVCRTILLKEVLPSKLAYF